MAATIRRFFQKETVFCISLFLAAASSFLVRPDTAYFSYPDYQTLSLLFCLMLIVSGFRSLGAFEMLGQALLKRTGSLRSLSLILLLLCFFSSMLITNDVALITFVPFTLLVFRMIRKQNRVLTLVVLETIAANLGSMATPIGNPQNLYIFSATKLSFSQFAAAVFPYSAMALVLLIAALLLQRNEPLEHITLSGRTPEKLRCLLPEMAPLLFLLLLCLLVVFRLAPYAPVWFCVTLAILIINRKLFFSVDYFLLLTFLCFFIFIGNMKRIPLFSELLTSLVQGHELWAGILTSQLISNVPATLLLSGFTENAALLLTAVNLGGLGTLIASLASLIAFQAFAAEFPERKKRFLLVFSFWNLIFLLLLTASALALS